MHLENFLKGEYKMEENNSLIQTETNWEDAYGDQHKLYKKTKKKFEWQDKVHKPPKRYNRAIKE